MIPYESIPSPCYVLEEAKLRRNLEVLKRVQDEAGVKILCALKGFSFFHAFPLVRQYLAGGTASSLHEARLCHEYMGGKAHLCVPAFREQEFAEYLPISSHITFNSLAQWEKYKHQVKSYLEPISCAIRFNPQYSEIETDLYNPAVAGSRLGMTRDKFGDRLPEGIDGLHFHTLCENDSFTLERTLRAAEALFADLIRQAKWINFGGGHHITRADYNVDHLIGLLKDFRERYDGIEVILEPGEAVGWQTGVLVSQVLDSFDSQGINVALLDVSISCHMPDCLEMPYKPRVLGASDAQPRQAAWRLGGMTCLAGDYVGDYYFPNGLKEGDLVVFDDMIHYTMVKTTTFNGVNLPNIGIWKEDNTFELLKSFGYESFKDRLG
ncbi:MAG: carboxynorspermidine decarboxylase [Cytophagales bacterium]|nr:carboxynorspermidine decarboxylase [Cytophagales bacterium]